MVSTLTTPYSCFLPPLCRESLNSHTSYDHVRSKTSSRKGKNVNKRVITFTSGDPACSMLFLKISSWSGIEHRMLIQPNETLFSDLVIQEEDVSNHAVVFFIFVVYYFGVGLHVWVCTSVWVNVHRWLKCVMERREHWNIRWVHGSLHSFTSGVPTVHVNACVLPRGLQMDDLDHVLMVLTVWTGKRNPLYPYRE